MTAARAWAPGHPVSSGGPRGCLCGMPLAGVLQDTLQHVAACGPVPDELFKWQHIWHYGLCCLRTAADIEVGWVWLCAAGRRGWPHSVSPRTL
jgi:hypothetical protein